MKSTRPPRKNKDGRAYDPTSLESVIEARLHHQRELAASSVPTRTSRVSTLHLDKAELNVLRHEIATRFLEAANLSEELRGERERFRQSTDERIVSIQEGGDPVIIELARRLAAAFSQHYEIAIERATGEFSDVLTQAVIARLGRKDFSWRIRAAIWAECLSFAKDLVHSRHDRDEACGIGVRMAVSGASNQLSGLATYRPVASHSTESAVGLAKCGRIFYFAAGVDDMLS